MDKILAIDTALESCSISVAHGDTIYSLFKPMGRGQTEALMPMIIDSCNAINIRLKDIDAVCVTRGPGSFTGVRVGLSVARTLSKIKEIPLYGLTTFEALGLFMTDHKNYGIVLESKRSDVYFQAVINHQPHPPIVTTYTHIKETYPDMDLIGNVAPLQFDQDKLTEYMIEAVRSNTVNEGQRDPFYLREADISHSKKKYRRLSQDVLDTLSHS